MTTDTPQNANDRRRKRKAELMAAGYSANVAGALASITDDLIRYVVRQHLGRGGIADGIPRGYLTRLLANALGGAPYPSAPSSLTPAEARTIEARASELRATARAELEQRRHARQANAIT